MSASSARPSRRRHWIPPLVGSALLAVGSIFFTLLTGGALGLVLWGAVILLAAVWNAWVTVVWLASWRRASPRSYAHPALYLGIASAFVAILWSAGVPAFQSGPKGLFAVAYLLAFVESAVTFVVSATRTRRDYLLPLYNLVGALYVALWSSQESGADATGALGLLVHIVTRDVAVFQTFNFFVLAGFLPIFIAPPFLAKPKGIRPGVRGVPSLPPYASPLLERRAAIARSARGISQLAGVWPIYAVVALLVFSPLAAQDVGSFLTLPAPDAASYGVNPNLTFAIVLGSLTDVQAPPPGYRDIVYHEVLLAEALRVRAVRFDVQQELLEAPGGLDALTWSIQQFRQQGFEIILAPFGRASWSSSHPTFADLNRTIHDEAVALASAFHPDWLFPFYEPNGQVQINLGAAMPTAAWVGAIDAAARDVRAASNTTRILLEVADGPQGPELFQALASDPNVDAVGFDLYPSSASDLAKVDAYDAIARAHPGKEFWISEFGLETIQFGQEAQARFIAAIVSRATTAWNVSGVCLWGLEDNVGVGMGPGLRTGLGIVTDGYAIKEGYVAYQRAVAAVLNVTA